MVTGLSHITLIVKDLDRAARFLEAVLEAKLVYDSGEALFSLSREKFFLIGGLWLCIMEGDALADRTYHHIAFQVQEEMLDGYITKIQQEGAEICQGRPRVKGEGRSVYFYDYDNHLFELHTGSLDERLTHYERKQ